MKYLFAGITAVAFSATLGLTTLSSTFFNAPSLAIAASQEAVQPSAVDYCENYEAFAERFIRPPFPENGDADEQKNWYALKKTCGRDLIALSLAKWPTFDAKPADCVDDVWEKFVAAAALSRFHIAESIFDENHGGTLIKKYYSTDYEPDKIIALHKVATEEIANVLDALETVSADAEWKSARLCELDLFFEDFKGWFAPYCLASLSKLPDTSDFTKNPDLFLTTADLLEFAVDYIQENALFLSTLEGVQELLRAPKAVEIRVFHGRFEGFEERTRDEIFARYCARIEAVARKAAEMRIRPKLVEATVFNGRATELFSHDSLPSWGAKDPKQVDAFYIVRPKERQEGAVPLYVVLHSAGHSRKSALDCTLQVGNHDIYTVPDDFYGIFVDCYDNKATDWWWGGRRADEPEISESNADRATAEKTPVEKRVLAEIRWAIETYGLDENRVYLCGNSMGGSGTLGLGFSNGDLFAAVKANVPAGIWHAYDRLQLGSESAPTDLPDPPIVLDYSAPNDNWSKYHEVLIEGVEKRKYPYILYWGAFGHENNDEKVAARNDLFKTFDWLSIRKNVAYPVFTNVAIDSPSAWKVDADIFEPGQRGAYFRWSVAKDEEDGFEIELKLASAEEVNSKIFTTPSETTADVSIRRLQAFRVEPRETVKWTFGSLSGQVEADDAGLVTIPNLTVKTEPQVLTLSKQS